MTGSLLFVAPICRLTELGNYVFALHVSQVYADSLLHIVGSVSLTVFWDHFVAMMVTGSGQHEADRTGIDFQFRIQVPWNTPEAFATLSSTGIYDLDTTNVPDVLGLRAWRPEAAVVKVIQGCDHRSVRVLVPDEKVRDRNFHDVIHWS